MPCAILSILRRHSFSLHIRITYVLHMYHPYPYTHTHTHIHTHVHTPVHTPIYLLRRRLRGLCDDLTDASQIIKMQIHTSYLMQRAHPRTCVVTHCSKPRDELVVGIDLGTTNSAIAFIAQDGKPRCMPNSEGYRTTPSVVTFLDDGQVVVGREAKRSVAIR